MQVNAAVKLATMETIVTNAIRTQAASTEIATDHGNAIASKLNLVILTFLFES